MKIHYEPEAKELQKLLEYYESALSGLISLLTDDRYSKANTDLDLVREEFAKRFKSQYSDEPDDEVLELWDFYKVSSYRPL